MSLFEIVTIITFLIGVLNWFVIRPYSLISYFWAKQDAIFAYTYLVLAYLFILYFVFILVYFRLVLGTFDVHWALLLGIVIYSMIGIWFPTLQRQEFLSAWISSGLFITSQVLAIFVLIGFWMVSWPAWLVPLILTAILIIALVISDVMRRLD
jgi:hypothetical protein